MSGDQEDGPKEDSSKPETVDPPVAKIRENLVFTAIKFLQNQKVKESPLQQKKIFLSKKGLTDDEIEMAVQKSGCVEPPRPVVPVQSSNNGPPQQIQYYQMPVPSFWSKTRDVINFFVVVFGGSYMVYHFVKKYLLPYLRGEDTEEKRLERVDKAVMSLQSAVDVTLAQIQANLKAMQTILDKQEEKLQNVSHQVSSSTLPTSGESHQIAEIKSEITSLKSMLLNRRQFAPAPQTSPVIPSWQREKKENDKIEPSSSESSPTPISAEQEEFKTSDDSESSSVTVVPVTEKCDNNESEELDNSDSVNDSKADEITSSDLVNTL